MRALWFPTVLAAQPTTRTKPCGICGRGDPARAFERFGYAIVRCRGCGLTYLDLEPSRDDISSFYSAGYFTGAEDRKGYADYVADRASLRVSFDRKLRKIEAMRRPGTILDIGCAAGFFLEQAAARGWSAYGQEVSAYAAGVARDALGDRVFCGHLDAIDLPDGSVDVITMWDVIEHLDDPLDVLARMRRLLRDDGLLVLCTGDIESWLARLQGRHSRIYNPPQHLYFYSRTTLPKLLEHAGWRVAERRVEWKTMTLRYFAYVLSCLNANPATRALRRMGNSRAGQLAFSIPLVDNMQVYAVKA